MTHSPLSLASLGAWRPQVSERIWSGCWPRGVGVGVGVGRSHTPDARSEGGAALRVSVWAGGEPPRHPGSVPFSRPRSHRGCARSRAPVVPALAPRATRSRCPGGTWREAESWAEVRARSPGPWAGRVGMGRVVRETALPCAGASWANPVFLDSNTPLWNLYRWWSTVVEGAVLVR